jgi:Protein of unknown function (DUF3300)
LEASPGIEGEKRRKHRRPSKGRKMNVGLVRRIAGAFVAVILGASGALGEGPAPAMSDQAVAQFTPEQLDQMLAPIALYPDPLLAQILMAATYPLEVVVADRWVQDRKNAALKGDRLTEALEQQPWDPSVKSLVPFPQILRMMDRNLEWTERLGDVFLANQAGVMDSVQRLRQRAEAAGKLRSTPQEAVMTEGQAIAIEPPSPEMVYVPVYDPSVVYGVWPYPAYPPYYFPDSFDGVVVGDFGFGWLGVAVIAPLWGWNHWDWVRHRIDIDRDRFAALNRNRPPIGGAAWEHDPSHRHGVAYRNPGVRDRFAGSKGAPELRRGFRGYPTGAALQPAPAVGHPQALRSLPTPRLPPAFESFGRGSDMRMQIERGHASRMSMPTFTPRANAPRFAPRASAPQFAPSGGGRGRP